VFNLFGKRHPPPSVWQPPPADTPPLWADDQLVSSNGTQWFRYDAKLNRLVAVPIHTPALTVDHTAPLPCLDDATEVTPPVPDEPDLVAEGITSPHMPGRWTKQDRDPLCPTAQTWENDSCTASVICITDPPTDAVQEQLRHANQQLALQSEYPGRNPNRLQSNVITFETR
jgi:hypothetical protein